MQDSGYPKDSVNKRQDETFMICLRHKPVQRFMLERNDYKKPNVILTNVRIPNIVMDADIR